ncbi:DUF475 domain-containing protein [Candidatus Kaiserbacteria bacterium]|nr:DUF475 domain-containing protein [Candidatus Kaiserbacteria bacterium]
MHLLPLSLAGVLFAWIGLSLGIMALGTAVLLVVLEVTLSFDNAVVNAGVLKHMTPLWQRRFLTWGILIAVFGTRAILPVLIVAASAWANPFAIAWMALFDPVQYASLLADAHYSIHAFGGMFLVMVAFKYFFNEDKKLHWIQVIEQRVSRLGNIQAIESILATVIVVAIALASPAHLQSVLVSGLIGIALFAAMQSIIHWLEADSRASIAGGLVLFMYLNVLDAAFSLDSVIGAFALSTNIVLIVVGLGIGAYFVRRLTLYLVHHGTLDDLIYIEHGAHWAILGLAVAMLAGLFIEVPQPITGFIGFAFLALAYLSSRRALR